MYQSLMEKRNQKDFQVRLQNEMQKAELDVLILTEPTAIAYATGFTGSFIYKSRVCGNAIAIVPSQGKVSLITSQFEYGGAKKQAGEDVNVIAYPVWIYVEDFDTGEAIEKEVQPEPLKTFKIAVELAKSVRTIPKVGVQRSSIPYDKYQFLIDTLGEKNIFDCAAFLARVKQIKLPWELEMCRYTAQIAEQTMQYVMGNTTVGMTEVDIVNMFEKRARELTGGHELISVNHFHTVGPNYWPSLMPREYVLQKGDIVRLDGGVNICGYRSDIARTYAVGGVASDDKKQIFETLLYAAEEGNKMLVPGAKLGDIYAKILEKVQKRGYTSYIRGHFGHATGLTTGEDYPMISPNNSVIIEPGMVFCLEVPFYGSKHHSYNIEDEFIITEDGQERLTVTNKTLFI